MGTEWSTTTALTCPWYYLLGVLHGYGTRFQCDCEEAMHGHHRWNCELTPTFAQTIRDMDCNPWTVIHPMDLAIKRFKPFQWDGEVGRYCGKGPCCMFDGHDGRCRM